EESDTAQGLTKKKGELIKRLFKIYVRRVIREESKKNLYIYFSLTNGGKIRKICRIIKNYHEISKSLANNRLK
ncbi:hypothetical protein OCD67_01970, partial [Bacillus pacificus]|uniref:hypothetical protein n=1 Tax=Bacillus pacificus TaxID=2026187 RepID=UPI00178C9F19